jgi:spermidine dehydrogenase
LAGGRETDRDLGMGRAITRRDFLNGVAVALTGALVPPRWLAGSDGTSASAVFYPPALTGMRGSHDGSYEVAHRLREPGFWEAVGAPVATGERYELVVVGAGLSGLTAAHHFRKEAGPQARILILDNHDDFGGHARRNEFTLAGRTVIGYGGSFSIDSPAPYSRAAQALVRELGVDVGRWSSVLDGTLYSSLRAAVFFDKETFGADRLVPAPASAGGGEGADDEAAGGDDGWRRFVDASPFAPAARAALLRLATEKRDYLPGLDADAKKARLARMSYADFLTGPAGQPREVIALFQSRPHSLYGVGIDAVPAQDAWGLGLPGFDGMGLGDRPGPGMNYDAIRNEEAARYFFHFPDGNASLARMLVRGLIPAAVPGRTAEDVVTARVDYSRLDDASSPARIRLRSTVVKVAHRGPRSGSGEVEVTYGRGGKLEAVSARRVILACWHSVIPYICPELPAAQKEALAFAVKVPIVYTNVLLKDWRAFQRLGVHRVHAPGGYHSSFNLDLPVSVGSYRFARGPEDPIVVHMVRTPCLPGRPARDQHRAGRTELLATDFATFERNIRSQLARTLAGGSFDPARDIRAITVNRWPHGYAYQYNSLFDRFWLEGGPTPCEAARRRFGRISIANADAGAYSYADAAIDHGLRAAREALS